MLAVYSKILQKRLSTNDDIESIVKEAYYFAESGKPGPLVSIIQKGSLTGKAWNSHLRISSLLKQETPSVREERNVSSSCFECFPQQLYNISHLIYEYG
jgi:acetolactate synthase-1/2/3 large subunit